MNIRWLVPSLIVFALAACSSAPKKPATAGHGGKSSGTLVQGRGSRPAHCPEGSPYAAAKEDLSTRGNYTAGGLYKPGVRDSTPDYIPNVACIPEPEVTAEERSAIGNKSPYVVLGKSYKVLDDTHDYVERGTASYYGAKFHGRLTSNREVYDMYQFTAAHKTLPLPSFARVTNLDNGESVIVRVNDRGPFHDGRVVDLSYAAAVRLGITQRGTGNVEVRALQPGESNLMAQKPSRRERRAAEAAAATAVASARPMPRHVLPPTVISIAWSTACRPMAPRRAASRPPPGAWPAPRRMWRSAACRQARRWCATPRRLRPLSPARPRARWHRHRCVPPRRRRACRSRWSAR